MCEFGGGVIPFIGTLVFKEGSVPIGTDGFLVGMETIRVVEHSRLKGVCTPGTVLRAPLTAQESTGLRSVTPKARCEDGVRNRREGTRNWRRHYHRVSATLCRLRDGGSKDKNIGWRGELQESI